MRVRGKRIVTPSGEIAGVLVVDGGRIVAIEDGGDADIDVGDAVIMPGLVDSHAHLNEPGRTEWEGFDTATRAAAAGGVTSVIDMPLNCIPVTTSLSALQTKRAAVADHAHIDYGFWGGIVPGNTHELAPMINAGADLGIRGFKAFLCHSGIDDFPASREADLRAAMPILARANVPLLVHAELESDAPEWHDANVYASYLATRPPRWEVDAIALVTRLARDTGCRVHIVHLSAADALSDAERARAEGVKLTLETCPHYLTLTAESVPDGHTEWKCAPPIREAENRERLWRGLDRGVIDMIVSDHSPCTPQLKHGGFERAWGGIASLQLALPLVWTEALSRGHTLVDLARWMAERPAQLAGLHRKGAIAIGNDADLSIFEPDEEWTITADALRFRHKVTPYLGRTVRGRVRQTILRGTTIYRDDAYPALAHGREIPRD